MSTAAEQKQIQHTNTLDEIAVYIKDRKIAQLKKMFPENRQDTVYTMFYYWNKKKWKQTGDEQIVFQDDEYIVVWSTSAYNEHRGEYFHKVNVFGIDNNIPWVHRLPWQPMFEDEKAMMKITKDDIRRLMGFDNADNGNLELSKVYRLQGDLTIRLDATVEFDFNRHGVYGKARQINFRFANHLIIIGNAVVENGFGLVSNPRIIIPYLTKCFVIHDEHRNTEIWLRTGIYRFGLLRRHHNS